MATEFEIDIDALLAAESDEDDENLPQLERSLEEILDEAWLGEEELDDDIAPSETGTVTQKETYSLQKSVEFESNLGSCELSPEHEPNAEETILITSKTEEIFPISDVDPIKPPISGSNPPESSKSIPVNAMTDISLNKIRSMSGISTSTSGRVPRELHQTKPFKDSPPRSLGLAAGQSGNGSPRSYTSSVDTSATASAITKFSSARLKPAAMFRKALRPGAAFAAAERLASQRELKIQQSGASKAMEQILGDREKGLGLEPGWNVLQKPSDNSLKIDEYAEQVEPANDSLPPVEDAKVEAVLQDARALDRVQQESEEIDGVDSWQDKESADDDDWVDLDGWIPSEPQTLPPEHSGRSEMSPAASERQAEQPRSRTPALSPLQEAEEQEKRHATLGASLEEGVSSQPMRLDGIQKGPPAIGLLTLDTVVQSAGGRASIVTARRDLGLAVCLAVHPAFIAVGFSKGSVLVLPCPEAGAPLADDSKATVLTPSSNHSSPAGLDFSTQGDLLLAGYADGALILWDLQKWAPGRVITQEHASAIVHVKFLGQDPALARPPRAISADSKGVVLIHVFNMVPILRRFTVTTQCLLDGSRGGAVFAVAAELPDEAAAMADSSGSGWQGPDILGMVGDAGKKLLEGGLVGDESSKAFVLVTASMALVVRLTPSLEVIARLERPKASGQLAAPSESAIPYIAWQRAKSPLPAVNGVADKQFEGPDWSETGGRRLVWAWDRRIQIFAIGNGESKVVFDGEGDSSARGVAWLDDQMFVVLNSADELCLRAADGPEVERIRLQGGSMADGEESLVSHSNFTTAAGSVVGPAYHNSLARRDASVYCLGTAGIQRARLMSWKDRIGALQEAGDWMGALRIAMDLYDGSSAGVTGLPKDLGALQEAIMPRVVDLVHSYLGEAFEYIRMAGELALPASHSGDQEQYARVGGVAIEFLVHLNRTDLLFDDVARMFQQAGQPGVFLELLEPYILKDMLSSLPPKVMQDLVEHYGSHGWLNRVEQCILHMDLSVLDFNQVVRLCREHRLFSALIHLFTSAMDDFITPLEDLLTAAKDHSQPHRKDFGYKLLVYLKFTFRGLYFPPGRGSIPEEKVPFLRNQILRFLLTGGSGARGSNPSYPRLQDLLSIDTGAALEALSHAFPPTGQLALPASPGRPSTAAGAIDSAENSNEILDFVVKALVEIFFDFGGGKGRVEGSGGIQLASIVEFVSRFVASWLVTVDEETLWQLSKFMCTAGGEEDDEEKRRRKEDVVLGLVEGLPAGERAQTELLDLCEKAQYWQVCARLLSASGTARLVDAFDFLLRDRHRPMNVFPFLSRKLFETFSLQDSKSTAVDFRLYVLKKLPDLVQVSSEATLTLVSQHFSSDIPLVLAELSSSPSLQFAFLKAVYSKAATRPPSMKPSKSAQELGKQPGSPSPAGTLAGAGAGASLLDLQQRSGLKLANSLSELYVELLCQFEPRSVLQFLQSHESYRLDQCLQLCRKYGVNDGTSFLLERTGKVTDALDLLLADLAQLIRQLDREIATSVLCPDSTVTNHLTQSHVMIAIESLRGRAMDLCQRNHLQLQQSEAEKLWLHLLDRFVLPLQQLEQSMAAQRLKRKQQVLGKGNVAAMAESLRWDCCRSRKCFQAGKKVLAGLVQKVVDGMKNHVPPAAVLAAIVTQHPGHEFADFSPTFLSILASLNFEKDVLSTVKRMIEFDVRAAAMAGLKNRNRGVGPHGLACHICGLPFPGEKSSLQPVEDAGESLKLFRCSHGVHSSCCQPEEDHLPSSLCPLCLQTKADPTLHTQNHFFHVSDDRVPLPVDDSGPQGGSSSRWASPQQPGTKPGRKSLFTVLKKVQSGEGLVEDEASRLKLRPPTKWRPLREAKIVTAASSESSSGQAMKAGSSTVPLSKRVSFQQGYKAALGLLGVAPSRA